MVTLKGAIIDFHQSADGAANWLQQADVTVQPGGGGSGGGEAKLERIT